MGPAEESSHYNLTGLTNGENYTISIVASTNSLSSAPEQATVGLGMFRLCVCRDISSICCQCYEYVLFSMIALCSSDFILRLCSTVPSAPVLDSTPTATTTTITISGSVPSGSVVTGYVVQWQRDTSLVCPGLRDVGSITVTSSSFTGRTITGLEPGNRYTITVTVSNGAGSGPISNAVTAMTEEAGKVNFDFPTFCKGVACKFMSFPLLAPSPPPEVTTSSDSPFMITVEWGEVLCADQNGAITGYSVQYGVMGSGNTETMTVSGASTTQTTISGLNPSTNYSIQVAAVNNQLIGTYSSAENELTEGVYSLTVTITYMRA